jgi:hypothetical protein
VCKPIPLRWYMHIAMHTARQLLASPVLCVAKHSTRVARSVFRAMGVEATSAYRDADDDPDIDADDAFSRAVGEAVHANADPVAPVWFALHGGDASYGMDAATPAKRAAMAAGFYIAAEPLASAVPMATAIGNHDMRMFQRSSSSASSSSSADGSGEGEESESE